MLAIWLLRYNRHRPHGGIKYRTPISRVSLAEGNLLRLHSYSVFERSMSPGLTRGWVPVRVKKTRQTKSWNSTLIPSEAERL
ncbi:hypothetical protein Nham_3441 [Nitrobacter hamburgensis X14]|uniref:Uncharacterized protein n=1 Tax=Nitrobacter hamburgensis (strain DSM 10229 / NCIMB 13809 / X14) TaxID=323097 RepID=Q1QHX6_NITHX|nr:hypothetical protein Nham_3441 [Nitrobacter hamburgensis X14]